MTPPTLLTAPREGTPAPIETPAALDALVDRLATGTGPLAVDAERASGHRYGSSAYLVQLRRAGAGTALIDPIAFGRPADLSRVAKCVDDAEWVLHAASQDLACLAEVGMRPARLFDTELAGRLAGFERVGLAALTERLLGFALEKHHSAVDWSTRPLPASWLSYAALDVELLVELRHALAEELAQQGKTEWAAEEFAALVNAPPPAPRADPWRRTSGIHQVKGTRALARVKALWEVREEAARGRDVAPRRVLPDAAIIAAAEADPTNGRALHELSGFAYRSARPFTRAWLDALAAVRGLPEDSLPVRAAPTDFPPPYRWSEKDPVAAERLAKAREVVNRLSEEHRLPPENLLTPDTVRRLAWSPPSPVTAETIGEALASLGARNWQITLTADQLTTAMT